MTWVVMFFVLIVAGVLQMALPAYPLLGQARFPALLAVVLYYALNYPGGVMLAAALLAGFFLDTLSAIPLGYSSFCFCLIGWAGSRCRNVALSDSMITLVFFGAVAAPVSTVLQWLILGRGELVNCTLGAGLLKVAGSGVLGMLTVPVIFLLVRLCDQAVGNIMVKESLDDVEWPD